VEHWWEELADQAADELSKYLVKTAQSGITGKLLSRSKGWRDRCQVKDLEDVEAVAGEPVVCESCEAVHSWNFIGPLVKLAGGFEEYALTARLVMELDRVYKYGPTGPCGCWTPPDKDGQEKTPPSWEVFYGPWEASQSNFLNVAAQYN
jgi:hypothetical protein